MSGSLGPVVDGGVMAAVAALVVHLLDRWRYRRKPALDVAGLAQQVAQTTMEHAQAEIERTWAWAERRVKEAEAEVHQVREELATLRSRLDDSERSYARQITDLTTKLAAAQAELAAKNAEIERLRGLTEHAQSQLGSAPTH